MKTRLLDGNGYIQILETSGSDLAIVAAARVKETGVKQTIEEFKKEAEEIGFPYLNYDEYFYPTVYADYTRGLKRDYKLLDYMMKHDHTSPFEMADIRFTMRAPNAIMTHYVRHRTMRFSHLNQESFRYTEINDDFYVPQEIRGQSDKNHQGSIDTLSDEVKRDAAFYIEEAYKQMNQTYVNLLRAGVAREQARFIVPSGVYTTATMKIDLLNLMKLLKNRNNDKAQYETQVYAIEIEKMFSDNFPLTYSLFKKYVN